MIPPNKEKLLIGRINALEQALMNAQTSNEALAMHVQRTAAKAVMAINTLVGFARQSGGEIVLRPEFQQVPSGWGVKPEQLADGAVAFRAVEEPKPSAESAKVDGPGTVQ